MKEDFQKLVEQVEKCNSLSESERLLYSVIDTPKIREGVAYAKLLHRHQFRKSGDPYAIHPILVAVLVGYFYATEEMVIASLLHDTVEDNPNVTIYDIRNRFGDEIANLVSGVTKISALSKEAGHKKGDKRFQNALNFRGLLLHSIGDARVLLIKLADRLHNMLTLHYLREEKRRRIAEETLIVYAPIAHRLGIAMVKNILEDLSFKYLLPVEYQKIDHYIQTNIKEFKVKLNSFISKIGPMLEQRGIGAVTIKGRIKHHYSIYQKMQRKGISIEEVLDLLAVRIVTAGEDPHPCYEALGVVHLNFRPLIYRFKDYIALPKENGYQTLHTTVYDGNSIIEVQIRNYEMDLRAEYGVAAHWKYKGDYRVAWLKDLQLGVEEDVEDFYELVKNDLYSEDIVVYTPKGDTVTLPRGATALDFAYKVHTEVGNRAVGAYINNEQIPLLTHLKTGNVVRIEVGEKPIPRCSWLPILKTSKAKYYQKKLCRKKEREIAQKIGIALLRGVFEIEERLIKIALRRLGLCPKVPELYRDRELLGQMVRQLYPTIRRLKRFYFKNITLREVKVGNFSIYTNRPIGDVAFNYCCHPKFGDTIIALLTEDKRVVEVHQFFCREAEKRLDREKGVFIQWSEERENRYFVVVNLPNRRGELAKFVNFVTKLGVFINSIQLSEETNNCRLEVTINRHQAEEIKTKIGRQFRLIEFTSKKDAYNG